MLLSQLLLLGLLYVTTTNTQYTPCIFTGTLQERTGLLHKAYTEDVPDGRLDVIFIIDRSKSIAEKTFNKTKAFISSLIQSQVSTGELIIHPQYARISLLSFGRENTIDVNGIQSTGQKLDACIFENELKKVRLDKSTETQPSKALNAAKGMFESKNREGDVSTKRILWVFSDGDFHNEDAKDDGEASRATVINDLRLTLGVEVFSVGIGRPNEGWLSSASKEENLRSLATDADHYMCVEEWQQVVDMMDDSPGTTAELSSPIYGPSLSSDMGGCQDCGDDARCACEVTKAAYTCYDCSADNEDHAQYEYVCGKNIPDPAPDPSVPGGNEDAGSNDAPDWLLYAIIGACALGLLLLIFIIVCICCLKRRRQRNEEKSHPGPALPPPPLPRRPHKQFIMGPDDSEIYANTMNMNAYDNRSSHKGVSEMYLDDGGVEPPAVNNDYRETRVNSNLTEIPEVRSSYQEVELGGADQDMDGWSDFLNELKAEGNLEHLAVSSVGLKNWAHTQGSKLPANEVKALDTAFRQGELYQANQLKIRGNRYNIIKADSSELQMHAKRPKKQDGRMSEECVWVSKAGDYVIVGVASLENDVRCQKVVADLYRHLAGQVET